MPAFRLILIVCLLWATAVAAESTSVRYTSNTPERGITDKVERLAGRQAYDSIGVILADNGYFDHGLELVGDSIIIETGLQYRLGEIKVTVVSSAGDVTDEIITRYRDMKATAENVTSVRENILAPYQKDGYYFASLNTDRITMQPGIILPEFKLITGPIVKIDRLRFKGLRKSRPDFIRKLSGLNDGDIFNENRFRDAIRKIEAGDYIRNDSNPAITPNENYDGVELLFHLSELKSNRLELGGGYLPGTASEDGEFVGRLRFESKNLFGSGRQINLHLDRKDRASSRIDFRFGQPFFIPDHLELALHFTQVDYDSSYHSFTIDGNISLITGGNTRIGAGGSWTKTEPQRSSQPPSRTLAGILNYDAQKLDYLPNPSSGSHLMVGLSYLRRTSWPDTAATTIVNHESMFEIGLDNYINPFGSLVLRLNLETKVRVTSRELIDYSEQFKLGGYGSLRGYRQEQFAGRRIFMGQAEFRLRPSRKVAAYAFSDIGYIYSRKEVRAGVVETEELTRIGSGAGLFVGGYTARMTLEIGWGRYDSFGDGKIHFGLTTMF